MKTIIYSWIIIISYSLNGMSIPVTLTVVGDPESGTLASYHFGEARIGMKAYPSFDVPRTAVTLTEKHSQLRASLLYRVAGGISYCKLISFNLDKGHTLTIAGQFPDSESPIEFSVDARDYTA